MAVKIMRLFTLAACLLTQPVMAGLNIQHWKTKNGARVYYARAAQLPMIDIRVVFDAGSARDGAKPGLASMTSHLLRFGSAGLGVDRIAELSEDHGIRMGAGSSRDLAYASIRSLSEKQHLDVALGLLANLVAKPDFPKAHFERERQRYILAVRQQQQSPAAIAKKAFYKAVYGDHPYAQPPSGTEASLKSLTLADLRAFHQRLYVARNAIIVIVGDASRKQAEAMAEKLSAGLPAGKRAAPLPKVQPLKTAKVIRIHHPSSQTHVLIGQPGNYRGDPDYFTLYVGNHALGGSGLVSRISDEIREKRGLSYSSYSYFSPLGRKGPFIMGLQTSNKQASQAIAVLWQTLKKFIKEGITAKELEASKKNITGGYALRVSSNGKITAYLSVIGFYGLPLNYLDTFNDNVRRVSAAKIRDAFARRLDPSKMVTVIVGGGQAKK